MVLSDYLVAQKRIERMTKEARRDSEWTALHKATEALEREIPLRRVDIRGEEERAISGFRFISQVTLVSWPKGSKGAMVSHPEKEQTFFVLAGHGTVTIGDETRPVTVGDVVFVPWKAPHTTEAGNETLTYLCLNTHVIETKEKSFEEMYNGVAPDRIARWKSRDTAVGE